MQNQLNAINAFNDRILSTVYWALGCLGGFTLLLIGFNWFTSYRMVDRDKKALSQELSLAIQNQISSLRSEMTSALESRSTQLVSSEIAKALQIVTQTISGLESQVRELRFTRFKHDQRYWETKDIPGNVFSSVLRRLELAAATNDEYEIGDCLATILKLLLGARKVSLFSYEKPQLVATLDKLPSKFLPDVEAIKTKLRDIPAS